jgi:hypothetical protein
MVYKVCKVGDKMFVSQQKSFNKNQKDAYEQNISKSYIVQWLSG